MALLLAWAGGVAADCETLPQPDGPVHVMVTDSSGGTLYLGGDFSQVGGESRLNLAAISLETCAVTGWEPTANGEVRAMWLSDDDELLYVGGDFTVVGGRNHVRLAAVRTGDPGETLPTWDPPAPDGAVHAIIPSDTGQSLFVAGAFTAIGAAPRHGLVELTRSVGSVTGIRLTLDDDAAIHALALDGNRLYFGGDFAAVRVGDDEAAFVDRSRAAAVAVDARELGPWAPAIVDPLVHVLEITPDRDAVRIGTAGGVLAVEPDLGEPLATWQPQVDGAVRALLPSFDRSLLYIGGAFDSVNGVDRARLAALRAVDASLVDGEAFAIGDVVVHALARSENTGTGAYRLYVGGVEGDGIGGRVAGFTIAPPELDPPLTTAQPAGSDGPFNSNTIEPVTLTCDDFGGSGCAVTYFTTNGSEPDTASSVYNAPINLLASMTLRFFSVDNVGNREAVRTEVYEVETAPPQTTASPTSRVFEGRELRVTLSCSDSGSGCAATHYTTDGSRPTADSPVYDNPIIITGTTVLQFFSVDVAGNAEGVQREEYVRNRGEVGALPAYGLLPLLAVALWRRRRGRPA